MNSHFRTLKIQSQLLYIFGFIITIGVLISGWTIIVITSMDRYAQQLFEAEQELNSALKTAVLVKELEVTELSYILTQDPTFLHEHNHYLGQVEFFVNRAILRADSNLEKELLFQFEREQEEYNEHVQQIFSAGDRGEWETASELSLDSALLLENMVGEVQKIVQVNQPIIVEQLNRSYTQVIASAVVGSVALIFFLGAALIAAIIVNNQVTRPVARLQQAAQAIEEDDFDPEMLADLSQRSDEVGHLARVFVDMAAEARKRELALEQQAEEIRHKIARTR